MQRKRKGMFPVRNPLSLPGEIVADGFQEPYSYDHRHTLTIQPFEIDSTGKMWWLPQFPIGYTFGNSISLMYKRIELRYSISVKNPLGVAQRVRVVIAYDRQGPTDDNFNIGALLEPPVTVLSPFRTDVSKRFLSLMDRVHDLSAHGKARSNMSYSYVRYIQLPLQIETTTPDFQGYPVFGALRLGVITTEPAGNTSSMFSYSFMICMDYNKSPSEI